MPRPRETAVASSSGSPGEDPGAGLSGADLRLIAECRAIRHGKLVVVIQDGTPVRIERGVQSKKLV